MHLRSLECSPYAFTSVRELLSSRRKCFRRVGSETPYRPMHIAISLWVAPSAAKFWTVARSAGVGSDGGWPLLLLGRQSNLLFDKPQLRAPIRERQAKPLQVRVSSEYLGFNRCDFAPAAFDHGIRSALISANVR